MNSIWKFIKTTFIGGILFLLPFVVMIILVREALRYLTKLVTPLARFFPFETVFGIDASYMFSIFILVFIAFLAGLVARTGLALNFRKKIEYSILCRIPGYSMFKRMAEEKGKLDPSTNLQVALVPDDEKWQFCFILEWHSNDFVTVFIPDAPNPTSGSVAFYPNQEIRIVDVPVSEVIKCLSKSGLGAERLLEGKKWID